VSVKLVPTFADRGCRVVSATDPHDRILGFLDRKGGKNACGNCALRYGLQLCTVVIIGATVCIKREVPSDQGCLF
jgi:hypothetical protein